MKSFQTINNVKYNRALTRFQGKCSHKDSITGCINWIGTQRNEGYGIFEFLGRCRQAHAVAYELHHMQDVQEGMIVRHLCPIKNKLCVNPEHLEVSTRKQNGEDEVKAGYSRCGSKSANAKISEETAKKIFYSYKNGQSVSERALLFKTSCSVVSKIDRAERCKHLMTTNEIEERQGAVKSTKRCAFSDTDISAIMSSTDSLKCQAQRYNVDKKTIQNVRNGKCISVVQQQNLQCEKIVQRLLQQSKKFVDSTDNTKHWLFKGNDSKNAKAKRLSTSYFGAQRSIAFTSYCAHNKIMCLPKGHIIRHKCLYKYCINIDCLEIGTALDNARDKLRDNTQPCGENSRWAKMTERSAIDIKQTKGICCLRLRSLFFDVKVGTIHSIESKKSWKHLKNDIPQTSDVITNLENFVTEQQNKKARFV